MSTGEIKTMGSAPPGASPAMIGGLTNLAQLKENIGARNTAEKAAAQEGGKKRRRRRTLRKKSNRRRRTIRKKSNRRRRTNRKKSRRRRGGTINQWGLTSPQRGKNKYTPPPPGSPTGPNKPNPAVVPPQNKHPVTPPGTPTKPQGVGPVQNLFPQQ